MSNRDPHMGSSPFEEITFRDKVDDDFCRAITEAYRDSNMRVVLQADHYVARIPENVHARYPMPKTYQQVMLAPPDSEGILLDGKIKGARMVPFNEYVSEDGYGEFYDNVGEFNYTYRPYAVLSDVVTIPIGDEQELFVTDVDEEIWVPIEIKNMTLYQPAQL
jgi:hypothetical protein